MVASDHCLNKLTHLDDENSLAWLILLLCPGELNHDRISVDANLPQVGSLQQRFHSIHLKAYIQLKVSKSGDSSTVEILRFQARDVWREAGHVGGRRHMAQRARLRDRERERRFSFLKSTIACYEDIVVRSGGFSNLFAAAQLKGSNCAESSCRIRMYFISSCS